MMHFTRVDVLKVTRKDGSSVSLEINISLRNRMVSYSYVTGHSCISSRTEETEEVPFLFCSDLLSSC